MLSCEGCKSAAAILKSEGAGHCAGENELEYRAKESVIRREQAKKALAKAAKELQQKDEEIAGLRQRLNEKDAAISLAETTVRRLRYGAMATRQLARN